jgi:FAD/FMN-containing dehydrogenase
MIPRISHQNALEQIYQDYLNALKQAGFEGDIETAYSSRLAVATDNSVYQVLPQAVIFPRGKSDVVRALKIAAEDAFKTVTFSPRGGGTGTNGQSLTDGIVSGSWNLTWNRAGSGSKQGWSRIS